MNSVSDMAHAQTRCKILTAVDLTAARLTLLANIDIGLMATAGRERVVRAAERIAVAKAREAILQIRFDI